MERAPIEPSTLASPPNADRFGSPLASDGGAPSPVRHEISARVVVKVVVVAALTLGALWLVVKLATILLLLFVAFLLTAALDPVAGRLERRGLPRPVSVALLALALVAVVALMLLLLIPPLIDQGVQFGDQLPTYIDRAKGLSRGNPALVDRLRAAVGSGSASPTVLLGGTLAIGAGIVKGVSDLVILLVMTVYLLIDGERSYGWAVHFLPPRQRAKVRRALPEISRVVSGYLIGQVVTSLLFGVFAYLLLRVVGMPQPLLLAVAAALLDAIPVAGVLLATAPAALLALTVSPQAASIVLGGYLIYHQLESHVLVPRIYAGRLRISSFAVLVAALVGWTLLGIVGVLLALPVAAAVPVVERIWREEPAPPA